MNLMLVIFTAIAVLFVVGLLAFDFYMSKRMLDKLKDLKDVENKK